MANYAEYKIAPQEQNSQGSSQSPNDQSTQKDRKLLEGNPRTIEMKPIKMEKNGSLESRILFA